jgi:hypothetical protein
MCPNCADTGYFCAVCLNADGNCICEEGPELMPCEDCPEEDE